MYATSQVTSTSAHDEDYPTIDLMTKYGIDVQLAVFVVECAAI